jgi:hypothetical protein
LLASRSLTAALPPMSAEPQLSHRSRLGWGGALVVLSIVLCSLIYFQPQQLNAPAWVAYSAATAFLVAGLLLLAGAAKATRTQNWLGVALAVAMVLPGSWVAFGKGERQCTMSLPLLPLAAEALCRAAFGVGAVLGVVILALYIRRALGRQRGG